MRWNWQLPKWPHFNYNFDEILSLEKQFLLEAGKALASLKNVENQERNQFIIEILSEEGLESAKIEGEILDRQSLQSSIQKHFGLKSDKIKEQKEAGMAELLCSVYDSFDKPLTHEMLFSWHAMLFKANESITDCGKYRTHQEPMQIVSNRYGNPKVFFEAPPSDKVHQEMSVFIEWFNSAKSRVSILGIASIAHVYFESIHPFEDGNGRIGRALVEKILSQSIGRPILIAVSKILEAEKKNYYCALEKCNKTLDVQDWILYFADVILKAQKESLNLLYFLIEKTKFLTKFLSQINSRQEKALLRVFAEGLKGFKGGLSAENYIAITKASRATATRDLNDLVQKEALTKTGVLRHTRYHLNL